MTTSAHPADTPQRDRRPANQPERMAPHDAWAHDSSSRFWLTHMLSTLAPPGAGDLTGTQWSVRSGDEARLSAIGRAVGSWEWQDRADLANVRQPELETYDRNGRRIDAVRFDRSWHELLAAVTGSGVCGLPWNEPGRGYLVRAAGTELWGRLDMGVMCPVTMTTAAIPVLRRHAPDSPWIDRLARDGNPPAGAHALAGMAMTEPQGGSDLSGSSTVARPLGDGTFALDGHKWFCSHPVADVLLVLARDPEAEGSGSRGLSCFLVEGWRGDGERNGIELQRLKRKLGTHSLASAEVMLRDARGVRLGAPGAGVRTIIEMVVHTRMDCTIGSAGIMTRAVMEAVSHASGRQAFGGLLVDQPLMRMVLADLALEREGALALAYDVAHSFEVGSAVGRLSGAAAKYWVTRRAVQVCVEAVEALGGNGYTEDWVLARLYRDAQVNSTWEGSGNVMALDTLRALGSEPELVSHVQQHLRALVDLAPDELATRLLRFASEIPTPQGPHQARGFAGRVALALQAGLLAHRAGVTGTAEDLLIARAFVATRLDAHPERVFGDGPGVLAEAAEPLIARMRVG